MIDKFISKYEEFAANESLEDFSQTEKIALFGVYLEALRPSQPSGPTVAPTPAPKNSRTSKFPNRKATFKQKNLIRQMAAKGQLPSNTSYDGLTIKQASNLINQGINTENGTHSPAPAPSVEVEEVEKVEEPEGEFTGSYNNSSGKTSSKAHFWQ